MATLKVNVKAGSDNIASFKATIIFVFDVGLGYIIDWRIKFEKATIDLYTTNSWFNAKSSLHKKYLLRKKLFDKLRVEQRPRNSVKNHKLITLNHDQIKIIQNYFNSSEYNSTIYEIISLFKGSNPSGTNKNPDAAQIWEIDSGHNYNINIFLRYFIDKNNTSGRKYTNQNEKLWENNSSESITIDTYLNIFPRIKEIFSLFQKSNSNNDNMKLASKYAKSLMKDTKSVENDVNNEYENYKTNINSYYLNMNNAYERIFSRSTYSHSLTIGLQKAHILPRWFIKRMMLKSINNQNKYNKWRKMISDQFNFLPLDSNTHNAYDRDLKNDLYWDTNGKLSSLSHSNLIEFVRFSQINTDELNSNRLKYLNLYKQKCINK